MQNCQLMLDVLRIECSVLLAFDVGLAKPSNMGPDLINMDIGKLEF
jgi:hypothetical protein